MEEEKQKRFLRIMEQYSQRQRERKEKLKREEEAVRQFMKETPLHTKIENEYLAKVEAPLLEQKKKKLEELRLAL